MSCAVGKRGTKCWMLAVRRGMQSPRRVHLCMVSNETSVLAWESIISKPVVLGACNTVATSACFMWLQCTDWRLKYKSILVQFEGYKPTDVRLPARTYQTFDYAHTHIHTHASTPYIPTISKHK